MKPKQFKTEKYYEITCDLCSRHLSTDFGRGMAPTPNMARKWAEEEGFILKNKKNICPKCKKS